ncbi:hypothetical protein [Methylocystis iwaonis]|uniref:hypothetical protein n=1 Tax=Methylocystis iwaonis TaxID=2885079 RepID=UPI002E7BABFC|nr:hypothetical protein [Methylocystis iwaonis]
MATRPKAKKTRPQRRAFLVRTSVTPSVKTNSAENSHEVTRDVTSKTSLAGAKNSTSFNGGPEALRAHLALFRDDLMRLDEFLAARRMTRLLRDFDYLMRALQRSRV